MIRYPRRFRAFAMCLSALAGFVDAAGFVLTGGLFVSFMSGNSTWLAVTLASGSALALKAGALILTFLTGVVAGALLAAWRPHRRKCLVLGLCVAALLLSAATIDLKAGIAGPLLLAFAMGSLNNVFLRDGEVSIGVTYMTGTLVRAGQRIAGAVRGEEPSDWLHYLGLWASLVAGAIAGALFAAKEPALSIWTASGLGALLTFVACRLESAGHEAKHGAPVRDSAGQS